MPGSDLAGALCLGAALFASGSAGAATLGLVVGVSDYAAYEPYAPEASVGTAYDLLGAANDARRIAAAMRQNGVLLPDSRLLIDGAATKAGFLAAWEAMLDTAAPGDTLIVTFAGHGGQERELAEPIDEADRRDEMVMFHDFDPETPGVGRLNDDELNALFRAAEGFEIVWVADSCHSGGLERSAGRTLSRFGGLFDGLPDPSLAAAPLGAGDEGATGPDDTSLSHVTQVLATASESFLVEETEIEGEMHGALSWYFAEALGGAADADGDGVTTRAELSAFLDVRIFTRMNQTQQPRILPRGDSLALLGAPTETVEPVRPVEPTSPKSPPPPVVDARLAVTVIGVPPPGLETDRVRQVDLGAALVFEELSQGRWEVRNSTGDRVTEIDVTGSSMAKDHRYPESAAPLVARAEALERLIDMSATDPDAPRLRLASGGALMHIGDQIELVFRGDAGRMPFLTLFNLASTGEVQFLHPASGTGEMIDDEVREPFNVVPPVGADLLVALSCPTPPLEVHDELRSLDGGPVGSDLIEVIANSPCALTMTGLYTAE